jgi:hypothetical protein
MCIVVHLRFCVGLRGYFHDNFKIGVKALPVIQLQVVWAGTRQQRGFGAANALVEGNKEAANSSMTYSLLDPTRHFPKCRSGWRNGHLHRLS